MLAIFVWTVKGVIDATIVCGILFGFILIGLFRLIEWIITKWQRSHK